MGGSFHEMIYGVLWAFYGEAFSGDRSEWHGIKVHFVGFKREESRSLCDREKGSVRRN